MEIVFVHFGPEVPKHLRLNLKRTCSLRPDDTVTLITDQRHDFQVNHANFSNLIISKGRDFSDVNLQLNHPRDFRNNFWFHSLARLIAVSNFVIAQQSPVLHIESDVIVSPDFPIEKFLELDRPIAYTIIGQGAGVASILWIKNSDAARLLKSYIHSSVIDDSSTTDMKVLGSLQIEHPNKVRILSSFPFNGQNDSSSLSVSLREDFAYTQGLFRGHFDAADVGQYLFGDDPRNHRGIKYLRKELQTSFLVPSKHRFRFSERREFIEFSDGTFRNIYSLHIHSKDSRLFGNRAQVRAFKKALTNQSRGETHVFVPSVFLRSVRTSLKRRARVFRSLLAN